MCCYRDIKNFERFNLVVQSMICLAVMQLKSIEILVVQHNNRLAGGSSSTSSNNSNSSDSGGNINNNIGNNNNGGRGDATADNGVSAMYSCDKKDDGSSKTDDTDSESISNSPMAKMEEAWTLPEIEKLLILVAKAFLMNFPLYIAYKHAVHSRLDDISPQDAQVG